MRPELIHDLACSLDQAHPLALHVFAAGDADGIEEGALVCPACGRWYAILEGVPHLVRDGLRLVEEELDLLERHRERLPAEAAQWKPFNLESDL